MADFYVIGVVFDAERKKAKQLSIQYNLMTHLSRPVWIDRAVVLDAIRRGYTSAVPAPGEIEPEGSGKRLHIVNVNGDCFLRTDQQTIAADEYGLAGK